MASMTIAGSKATKYTERTVYASTPKMMKSEAACS